MDNHDNEQEFVYEFGDELPEAISYYSAERVASVMIAGIFKGVALFLMQLTGDTVATSGGKMIIENLQGAEETSTQYAHRAIRTIGPYVEKANPWPYLPSPSLLSEYVPDGIMKPLSTLYDYSSTSMFMIMPSFLSNYFGMGRETFIHMRNLRDVMVVDPQEKEMETAVNNLFSFLASVATTVLITRSIQIAIALML